MTLLEGRKQYTFGRFEATVLALYTVLVCWLNGFHEPWADEAQAWLLARDCSLKQIFLQREHYEGTPALWHLLLWGLTRLHAPYASMHWLSVLLGMAAVFVLLRYGPFPAIVRALLPFGFALTFQTAVIARNYSLVPVLVFAACVVLRDERRRWWLLALLLGLLANTCALGFFVALGFVGYVLGMRKGSGPAVATALGASVLLAAMMAVAVLPALPALDLSSGANGLAPQHPGAVPFLRAVTGTEFPQLTEENREAAVRVAAENPQGLAHRHAAFAKVKPLALVLYRTAVIGFFAVSASRALAAVFLVLLAVWLWRNRRLAAGLPLLMVLLGGSVLAMAEHHISVVVMALIATLWLGWNAESDVPIARGENLFRLMLLVVLVEQAAWMIHGAAYEVPKSFDGSRAAAAFLAPKVETARIANIGFADVAIEPYLPAPLYANQATEYWQWNLNTDPEWHVRAALAQHPEYVMDEDVRSGNVLLGDAILRSAAPRWTELNSPRKSELLQEYGYREVRRFCGLQPAHFGYSVSICEVVYGRHDSGSSE